MSELHPIGREATSTVQSPASPIGSLINVMETPNAAHGAPSSSHQTSSSHGASSGVGMTPSSHRNSVSSPTQLHEDPHLPMARRPPSGRMSPGSALHHQSSGSDKRSSITTGATTSNSGSSSSRPPLVSNAATGSTSTNSSAQPGSGSSLGSILARLVIPAQAQQGGFGVHGGHATRGVEGGFGQEPGSFNSDRVRVGSSLDVHASTPTHSDTTIGPVHLAGSRGEQDGGGGGSGGSGRGATLDLEPRRGSTVSANGRGIFDFFLSAAPGVENGFLPHPRETSEDRTTTTHETPGSLLAGPGPSTTSVQWGSRTSISSCMLPPLSPSRQPRTSGALLGWEFEAADESWSQRDIGLPHHFHTGFLSASHLRCSQWLQPGSALTGTHGTSDLDRGLLLESTVSLGNTAADRVLPQPPSRKESTTLRVAAACVPHADRAEHRHSTSSHDQNSTSGRGTGTLSTGLSRRGQASSASVRTTSSHSLGGLVSPLQTPLPSMLPPYLSAEPTREGDVKKIYGTYGQHVLTGAPSLGENGVYLQLNAHHAVTPQTLLLANLAGPTSTAVANTAVNAFLHMPATPLGGFFPGAASPSTSPYGFSTVAETTIHTHFGPPRTEYERNNSLFSTGSPFICARTSSHGSDYANSVRTASSSNHTMASRTTTTSSTTASATATRTSGRIPVLDHLPDTSEDFVSVPSSSWRTALPVPPPSAVGESSAFSHPPFVPSTVEVVSVSNNSEDNPAPTSMVSISHTTLVSSGTSMTPSATSSWAVHPHSGPGFSASESTTVPTPSHPSKTPRRLWAPVGGTASTPNPSPPGLACIDDDGEGPTQLSDVRDRDTPVMVGGGMSISAASSLVLRTSMQSSEHVTAAAEAARPQATAQNTTTTITTTAPVTNDKEKERLMVAAPMALGASDSDTEWEGSKTQATSESSNANTGTHTGPAVSPPTPSPQGLAPLTAAQAVRVIVAQQSEESCRRLLALMVEHGFVQQTHTTSGGSDANPTGLRPLGEDDNSHRDFDGSAPPQTLNSGSTNSAVSRQQMAHQLQQRLAQRQRHVERTGRPPRAPYPSPATIAAALATAYSAAGPAH